MTPLSNFRRQRPLTTDISYLSGRADGLATAFLDGQPGIAEAVRAVYPELGETLSPEEARTVIAREHGSATWEELAQHVAALEKGEIVEPFIVAFEAIKNDDITALEGALAGDPELANAPGSNGNNLLGLACSFRRHDMVRLLLKAGADVDSGNRYGWTALHQAGYSNNCELAELLLEAGARIDLSGRGEGGTPLMAALFWGHREVADLLAARGIVPRNLRAAAGVGDVGLLESFVNADGSLKPEAGAARGFYRPHGGFPTWGPSDDPQEILDEAFVYACKSGRLETMGALLRHGAHIDADPYRGTGLTWAAANGRDEAVQWLLDHGASINLRGTFGGPGHGQGITALHLAAQSGKLETVKLLLANRADATLRDELYNGPPAGWAEHGEHPDIAAYLKNVTGDGE